MSESQEHRLNNGEAALAQLKADFNDWSAILTNHSLQSAFAIIAANWAVHGDANNILNNRLSTWSMAVVLLFLGLNLVGTRVMVRLHYKQFSHGSEDPQRWEREYQESKGKRTHWPYTKEIEYLGVAMRALKLWAPLTAASLFILSLFFGS